MLNTTNSSSSSQQNNVIDVDNIQDWHERGESMRKLADGIYSTMFRKRISPVKSLNYADIICFDKFNYYCNICKIQNKSGNNYSNAFNHIINIHPEELDHIDYLHFKDFIEEKRNKNKDKNKNSGQLTIFETYNSENRLKEANKKKLEKSDMANYFVKCIAHAPCSINTVCNISIKQLLYDVVGEEKIIFPKRTMIVIKLDEFLIKESIKYKRNFFDCIGDSRISLTTDISTSNGGFSYSALTAHYIDKSWELKESCIDVSNFPGIHSGENILELIIKQINRFSYADSVTDTLSNLWYNIQTKCDLQNIIVSIAADCATNNDSSLGGIQNVARIKCFGHRLNTLVGHLNENTSWKDMREPIVEFLLKIKRSSANMEELARVQKQNIDLKKQSNIRLSKEDVVKGPINMPRTRWTWNPRVIRRALEIQQDVFGMVVNKTNFNETNNKSNEFDKYKKHWIQYQSSLEILLHLFERVEFWIVQTESSCLPNSSLVIYALQDIKALTVALLDKLHTLVNEVNASIHMYDCIYIVEDFQNILVKYLKDFMIMIYISVLKC